MAIAAGQKLRVSDLTGTGAAAVGGSKVQMTADVTVNNTTSFTDATGLAVPVVAGATYAFDAWLLYTSGNAPDFKVQPSSPAGTTGAWNLFGYGRDVAPAADTGSGSLWIAADIGTSLTVAGEASGALLLGCIARGRFVTTAAGTFRLRIGQRTATAVNTIARAGSWLDVVRIA